jgi:predicted Rossmann fold nucleotide-binding protein DprA/Smf involved in DNA uptake
MLTAPLVAGRGEATGELLTPGELRKLNKLLLEHHHTTADLLSPDVEAILEALEGAVDKGRLRSLLRRGLLLSQAVERWRSRSLWVIGMDSDDYPDRLRNRLGDSAPTLLYGCGDVALLNCGGLAVVGSRHVDAALIEYTETVGQLAAGANLTVVSGAARGVDQASMRGALEAGGKVLGVMADSLERAALNSANRDVLLGGQLTLVTPFDPSAGFNVGHAMQRNKIIYALADAALVVNSDHMKGGTWAGAVEQLDKLRLVPVYVRSSEDQSKGLRALQSRGALPWPEPTSSHALLETLCARLPQVKRGLEQEELF